VNHGHGGLTTSGPPPTVDCSLCFHGWQIVPLLFEQFVDEFFELLEQPAQTTRRQRLIELFARQGEVLLTGEDKKKPKTAEPDPSADYSFGYNWPKEDS